MPEKGFFAIRLRELRTEAEMTQATLAERSGLVENTIRQFESGRREPTYETLVKLARALSVGLDAFAPDDLKPAKPTKRKGK